MDFIWSLKLLSVGVAKTREFRVGAAYFIRFWIRAARPSIECMLLWLISKESLCIFYCRRILCPIWLNCNTKLRARASNGSAKCETDTFLFATRRIFATDRHTDGQINWWFDANPECIYFVGFQSFLLGVANVATKWICRSFFWMLSLEINILCYWARKLLQQTNAARRTTKLWFTK